MLPPILEIFVLWHPDDAEGASIANEVVEHFHGTTFSGLLGGAIEVYLRSDGWNGHNDAPRPLPASGNGPEPEPASRTVVVPVVGLGLAEAVQRPGDPWRAYLESLTHPSDPEHSPLVLPIVIAGSAMDQTAVSRLLGHNQTLGASSGDPELDEIDDSRVLRDLAQAIAQDIGGAGRLTVFLSHTKHASSVGGERQGALIADVRRIIANTRLQEFFDAHDLQPGTDWANELRQRAANSALLALRTDLYASRTWCQREVRVAKEAGMPVVTLDAPVDGEQRGSFLMDHVPRLPADWRGARVDSTSVLRALNQLVDECLKRVLWARQQSLSDSDRLNVQWWAEHAPEPLTLLGWLRQAKDSFGDGTVRVLHPDPPLGSDELDVLLDLSEFAGLGRDRLEIMTPRGLAARGG